MTISLAPTKFAFIKARWHADIVDQSFLGFARRLDETEVNAPVETFDVPGAFEMPLLAKRLAMAGRFDAAAALVVDGGIYRHEFVAQSVVTGLMDVGLQTGFPILPVSLTPHNFHGSKDHHAFFRDDFVKKGEPKLRMPPFRFWGSTPGYPRPHHWPPRNSAGIKHIAQGRLSGIPRFGG